MRNKLVSVVGVNPPADIASGRIAEVRSRSMSCNCMTRTSQQECRGILESGFLRKCLDIPYMYGIISKNSLLKDIGNSSATMTFYYEEDSEMIKAMDHVTINIKDVEATLHFYGEILGLQALPSVDMGDHFLRYFALPSGGKLELIQYYYDVPQLDVEATNKGCARHLAFEVEDIRALEKKLTDAGFVFHVPVSYVKNLDFTGGLTKDPNGFELEFLQYGEH